MPAEGFEPPTFGLQNRCTTTVLSRPEGAYSKNFVKRKSNKAVLRFCRPRQLRVFDLE